MINDSFYKDLIFPVTVLSGFAIGSAWLYNKTRGDNMRVNGSFYTVGADDANGKAVNTQPEAAKADTGQAAAEASIKAAQDSVAAVTPAAPWMDREMIPGVKNRYLVIGGTVLGVWALMQ